MISAHFYGVGGLEVDEFDTGTGLGPVIEGAHNAGVNGVLVLKTRGVCGEQEDMSGGERAVGFDQGLVDREGSGLVGA